MRNLFWIKGWLNRFGMDSIRNRMITGFLFLTLLTVIISVSSLGLLDRTSKVAAIHGEISRVQSFTLLLFANDRDFFTQESVNAEFFRTGQSRYLEKREWYNREIADLIASVRSKNGKKGNSLNRNLAEIDSSLRSYNSRFLYLQKILSRRGFTDFGVEGQMRSRAHLLEQGVRPEQRLQVLTLRKNEKDFFLRNDPVYISAFRKNSNSLLKELKRGNNGELARNLEAYQAYFIELVSLHNELQLSNVDGGMSELTQLNYLITNRFLSLSEYSYHLSVETTRDGSIIFTSLVSLALVFSMVSGHWISKRLSDPIMQLSFQVAGLVEDGKIPTIKSPVKSGAREIKNIINAFYMLVEKTRLQVKQIKSKTRLLKKKNKDLRKLNHELDNFLYSTAHDMRSPLSSLLGLLNIIRYENRQEALEPYFLRMEKSINNLEVFIGQIVSYTRNKRTALTTEPILLHELISGIVENHRFQEGAQRISPLVEVSGEQLCYTDRHRLQIILNNLVSNAIKYADHNKDNPYFSVSAQVTGETILLRIEDNGIGIDQEHLDRIFEMFYRADYNSKGSGLGLFIFHETVKRMKGTVTVTSVHGAGTTFVVKLPNLVGRYNHHPVMAS